jgi:hypothetical protein
VGVRRVLLLLAATVGLIVGSAVPASAVPFQNLPNGASDCLGIQSSSSASGAQAITGACAAPPTATQTWTDVGSTFVGGWFGWQFANLTGNCLGVSGSSTAGGASVVQGTCASVADHSQIWRPVLPNAAGAFFGFTGGPPTADRFYWLKNGHSGLCLGVQTGGNKVIQGACNAGSATQQWLIFV